MWRNAAGGPAGAGQVPYLPPEFEPGTHMILLEGESDTMAAWQAAPPEAKKSIVGLSGTGSWGKAVREKGGLDALFGQAKVVWVVFDRDDPYSPAAESTDRAWAEIRNDLGRKAKRVVLPQGITDVAEFFMQYDWAAFRELLQGALQPVRHYPRLDLSQPPPPTDWLVEDLLVRGEASALVADGGVGKSMITMALALAVAGGQPTFLGQPLKRHGRVLYVDEENAADLVLQRLNALGIEEKHWANLDYLWHAGVDLAREPEKLLEEAVDLEPELIVLDSLSRVALGVEENSNTDMSMLFKKGIVPLARETGAAVVVIHHTSASGNGRPRGATSIRNAADEVISIKAAETKDGEKTGVLNIFPDKPRRQLTHLQARIKGDMEKDGWLRVEEITEDTPF